MTELFGLRCELCEDGKRGAKRKRALGCGVRPVRVRGSEVIEYDVVDVAEKLQKKGVRREFWGRDASNFYRLANAGDVWGSVGSLWECCPAWFSRYAGAGEALIAQHSLELMIWSEAGSHSLVHQSGELTPRIASIVNMLRNAQRRLSNEAQERAIRKRQGKT